MRLAKGRWQKLSPPVQKWEKSQLGGVSPPGRLLRWSQPPALPMVGQLCAIPTIPFFLEAELLGGKGKGGLWFPGDIGQAFRPTCILGLDAEQREKGSVKRSGASRLSLCPSEASFPGHEVAAGFLLPEPPSSVPFHFSLIHTAFPSLTKSV